MFGAATALLSFFGCRMHKQDPLYFRGGSGTWVTGVWCR